MIKKIEIIDELMKNLKKLNTITGEEYELPDNIEFSLLYNVK